MICILFTAVDFVFWDVRLSFGKGKLKYTPNGKQKYIGKGKQKYTTYGKQKSH